MAKITSEEEYERRKDLLERHKNEESQRIGRDLVSGAISGVSDYTGLGDAAGRALNRVIRRYSD